MNILKLQVDLRDHNLRWVGIKLAIYIKFVDFLFFHVQGIS